MALVVIAGCGDDGGSTACATRELDEVPETNGFERLDVETVPVAVITLDADASDADVADLSASIPMAARMDSAPTYPSRQLVLSTPGGEASEQQLRLVFDAARRHPRFESIDGIICTESP